MKNRNVRYHTITIYDGAFGDCVDFRVRLSDPIMRYVKGEGYYRTYVRYRVVLNGSVVAKGNNVSPSPLQPALGKQTADDLVTILDSKWQEAQYNQVKQAERHAARIAYHKERANRKRLKRLATFGNPAPFDGYDLRSFADKQAQIRLQRDQAKRATKPTVEQYPAVTWRVEVEPMDYQSLSDYGHFDSRKWSPFKVIDPNPDRYWQDSKYLYFHPENSYAHALKWFKANGYSKANADFEARKQVYQDLDNIRRHYTGSLGYYSVSVSAFVGCQKIDTDSIGGCEVTGPNDPHIAECIVELTDNILHRLPQTLESITQTYQQIASAIKL